MSKDSFHSLYFDNIYLIGKKDEIKRHYGRA